MGVDIGIYCTVDKESFIKVSPYHVSILDWAEELNGEILLAASKCTEWGEYRGIRVTRVSGWIGDLLEIIRGVYDGDYPWIKQVFIRDDCDGSLLVASTENIKKIIELYLTREFFGVYKLEGSFKN